jgi:hypothetical protein
MTNKILSHIPHEINAPIIFPIPEQENLSNRIQKCCGVPSVMSKHGEIYRYILANCTKCIRHTFQFTSADDINLNVFALLRQRIDKASDDDSVPKVAHGEN